ncbi:hypothetical protein EGH21_00910 [Halomicroarcula sp. F13]|uniref:Uncharacterized protein n=1 Tax=Haloarcula rubra TaxID=2487747 RepID=A0AAW4PJA4_9EURY|nr:hypothetical protein [Halomicroarcula rubra]MBX0321578.1 hypothetical protein [Halomicroarcula rubra]
MSDSDDGSDDVTEAVQTFLGEADSAYEEYDKGYTDADAILRRLETAIESLREATGSDDE